MRKGLIFYNSTQVLYFELQSYDGSFPVYQVVLEFITGQGGVY